MTHADLYQSLLPNKLAVLSSIAPDGSPQSALIGIAVSPELEIIFDTVKSSRKYPNLVSRAECSLVLGWSGEQTIQFEGTAQELGGAELERCLSAYFEAWPECRAHQSWPGIVYFLVKPTWIRYSDYDQSPPLIQEFVFGERSYLPLFCS